MSSAIRRAAVATLTLIGAASGYADVRIQSDYGGNIGEYLRKYEAVRLSGQRVIIDGRCVSACTLVFAVVPRERICVTSRAVLGFHAAWKPNFFGQPVVNAEATRYLLSLYPADLRNLISRHGGLSEQTIILRGRELSALSRGCS